jgi:hypothetical protein
MSAADSMASGNEHQRELALIAITLERDEWKSDYEALALEVAVSPEVALQFIRERDELRRKLHAQHIELMRRARRDAEIAHHLPAIAARLQAMATDAALGSAPKSWEDDPEIDWTGIER